MLEAFYYCTGILSEIFIFIVFLYCRKQDKNFRMEKDAVSYFGSIPKTARLFNNSLLVYTLLRLIFLGMIITRFDFWKQADVVLLVIFGSIGTMIAAIISLDRHYRVHGIAGISVALITIIMILIIGLRLVTISPLLGAANIIISLSLMLLSFYYLSVINTINAYLEIEYISFIFIWDILMTLALFGFIL